MNSEAEKVNSDFDCGSESTILTVETGINFGLKFTTQPQSLLTIAALSLWNKNILSAEQWEEELKKPLLRINLENTFFFPDIITSLVYNWTYHKKLTIPFAVKFAAEGAIKNLIQLKHIEEIRTSPTEIFSDDL